MSAFSVIPKSTGRYIAVRVWPGNEDDIQYIFGDRVVKADPDQSFYDYALVSRGGYEHDPVCRGDWLVLTPSGMIERHSDIEFNRKFTTLETVFRMESTTKGEEKQ